MAVSALARDAQGRFRIVAFVEGVSYIVLLFIAMPLKYLLDVPLAVRVVGSAHGALFVLYLLALVPLVGDPRWGIARLAQAFIASLVPFGTFFFDRTLRDDASRDGRAAP